MCTRWFQTLLAAASQKQTPMTSGFTLSRTVAQAELYEKQVTVPFGMLDDIYYCANDIDWYNIFIECFKNLPAYVTDRMDCDKFAFIFKTRVLEMSGLNSFAFVIGNIPAGRHGFNMFRDQNGWHILEPNPSYLYDELQVFEIGEHGYRPDKALL